MPKPRRRLRRRIFSGVSLLIVVVVVVGLYVAFRSVAPLLQGTDCTATGDGQAIALDTGQAGIAATIAGVAQKQAMPTRAVTVAFAAALQESKLRNLSYGDRDSVGVFQQRPSEGWGPRRDLEDPVYATSRFFQALAKVPGYQQMATQMTAAFTGQAPHGVWCWYAQKIGRDARVDAATSGLAHAFGPQATRATVDPGLIVQVRSAPMGWAVAAWLVSHAQQYRIDNLQYEGYQWTAANGKQGWAKAVSPAPPGSLVLG